MCPKDSDRGRGKGQIAFTLLEVLIALVASGILLTVLTRFYRDSYRSFNTQEQVAERNQNEYYTIKRLTEILQQAGSSLPDTGWDSVIIVSGGWMTVGSNPSGYNYFVSSPSLSTT